MGLMDDLRTLARWVPATDAPNAAAAYSRLGAFIKQHEPWYPPQQPGFGPWIEYCVGDKGPHVNDRVVILTRSERAQKRVVKTPDNAAAVSWYENNGGTVVAYCVKLDEG